MKMVQKEEELTTPKTDEMPRTILRQMLLVTAVSLLLANLLFWIRDSYATDALFITAVCVPLLLIGFWLLQKNKMKWLAHGFTAVYWLSITFYLLAYGSNQIPGPGAYIIFILLTLLLLRGRTTVIYSLLTLIVGLILILADRAGQIPLIILPASASDSTAVMQTMPQAFLIFVSLGSTYVSLRALLQTLRLNDYELQQIQQTLGQRTEALSATNDKLTCEIKERQHVEETLKQQRTFLRTIIDTIPNFVSVKNKDGRFLMVNKALANIYKTTPTAMEGHTLAEFHPSKKEVAQFEEGDHQVSASKQEIYWPEQPYIDVDGQKRWLQIVKRPLFDPATNALNVLTISTDITLEKTVSQALREKEENFRTLVQASFDGIVICIDHMIQEANVNFATMFGYTAVADVLGLDASEFLAKDDVKRLQEKMAQTPIVAMEATGIRLNKSTFPLEIVTHDITYQGQAAQITGYRDIANRKQAEEAEQHATKLESLSLMAGGLAHDFNNLLVAMMSQIAIAKAKIEPEHASHQNLDKAVQATETAALLTRQLLAYTGQGHFEISHVHLNELIQQKLQLFTDALPKNITFLTELHDTLPHIQADSVQIQQIFMNLLLNAAEALGTEPGTITIQTTPHTLTTTNLPQWQQHNDTLPPGDYVLLDVRDTGQGMDETTLNRIFDPFFSTKGTGRGLGLAAVMGIVRGHRGSVRAISQVGKGTSFQILFPAENSTEADGKATAVSHPTPQQNTVLIIDDERQVREALSDILDLEEIPTIAAASGQEGIDLFTTHQDEIGLIILDLSMPGMSGIEAFSALRDVNAAVKIVLSSGYTEAEILEKMAGTRPTGFLHKPYRLDTVLRVVQKHLAA